MKKAIELFGQNTEHIDVNRIKTTNYQCPFINQTCIKQSRLINYPMGACSVRVNSTDVIICPVRFKQNDIVFTDIAKRFFGTVDNSILFQEVKVSGFGSFDFVLVKHTPLKATVDDFVVIEFQSDSTTGTGALVNNVRDIIENEEFHENYRFGMNTYNTIKLSFIQMLMKGQVIENWGKNIVWVMQDFVFSNMLSRFDLERKPLDRDLSTHFFLYKMDETDIGFDLKLGETCSSSVRDLAKAFERGKGLPTLNSFIKTLEAKIQLNLETKEQ